MKRNVLTQKGRTKRYYKARKKAYEKLEDRILRNYARNLQNALDKLKKSKPLTEKYFYAKREVQFYKNAIAKMEKIKQL